MTIKERKERLKVLSDMWELSEIFDDDFRSVADCLRGIGCKKSESIIINSFQYSSPNKSIMEYVYKALEMPYSEIIKHKRSLFEQ
jgi:hypothetical protein